MEVKTSVSETLEGILDTSQMYTELHLQYREWFKQMCGWNSSLGG